MIKKRKKVNLPIADQRKVEQVCQRIKEVGMDVNETLIQRNGTHGDFEDNGRIMQTLKDAIREFKREAPTTFKGVTFHPFHALEPHQREALDMIMHKVGRILSGDANFADHWHDIAGYAKLCEDLCPK